MDSVFLRKIRRIVGRDHLRTGPADLEVYSYDASLARQLPGAVAFPADAGQTAAVVRVACEAGVPCVPRGFGTNLSGGSVAPEGGLVLCLSRLNRILAIRPERRCALVQPGVTNLELQNALAPLGFFYAPDPASQKVSTLGGNVAENSGGPRCVKYGVTKNHVLGMEVVLAGGERVRIGGEASDPPGLDLCGPLTGSEGTLGIVTELLVRILPLPESLVTLLAVFDDVADAARCVSGIMAHGILPSSLEMMDAPIMRAVEESMPCGYPLDAAAVLIIEVDGPAQGLASQAERIREICRANRSTKVREAGDAAERNRLWAGRRGAFGAVARISPSYLVTDCTVPRTKLPEALAGVAAAARRQGLSCGNVFHAGDGNLHPLLFFDSRDPDQLRRVHDAGLEIMQECVALGGTITGEHGVGLEKRQAMRLVFSEDDLAFQQALKLAFDPAQRLNPGKVLPDAVVPAHTSAGHAPAAAGRGPGSGEPLLPASAEEAAAIVRGALRDRVALVPQGAGRWQAFGNAPAKTWLPLGSSNLSALAAYDPLNQVVIAGAGMSLAALQRILADRNQWLPVRALDPEVVTLGGIAALNAGGPERLRCGALRDHLLGTRFVSGRGLVIRAGGRVLKNVAGYDVTRLMAGSAGTLGFLCELTLRVSPVPQSCRAVHATGPLERVAALCAQILRSSLDPAFVVAVPATFGQESRPSAPVDLGDGAPWRMTVGFEGLDETVQAQERRCAESLARGGLQQEPAQSYPLLEGPLAKQERDLDGWPILLRVDLPLGRESEFLRIARETFRPGALLADLGCGRVRAALSDLSNALWQDLCRHAAGRGGHVLLEKAPAEVRACRDVFGPPRPEWKLMHAVKDALDPCNVFSPGRLPGRK
ncbi:MAG: FAD-linked oxidase C-terminal domain-containing protein [bacterium]